MGSRVQVIELEIIYILLFKDRHVLIILMAITESVTEVPSLQ